MNKNIPIILKFSLLSFVILVSTTFSSCKKKSKEELVPDPEKGTVTDANGNVYETIKIGNQWWMTENLKATLYRDGSPIKECPESNATEWTNDTNGMYSQYLHGTSNANTGFLYNWYAIQNPKGILPEGWRIPREEDWQELEWNLGMTYDDINKTSWRGTNQGDKLKKYEGMETTGGKTYLTKYWEPYGEVFPSNESGFSAIAGGYRMPDGTWGAKSPNNTAFFWSSSTHGNEIWYRYLDYQKSGIFRYYGPKAYGFSVRYVKN